MYTVGVVWEVEGTNEFVDWYLSLSDSPKHRDAVDAVIEELVEHGPNLGRPHVDRVEASKFHNMKELRPSGAAKFFRVLFMFDPRRQAILLIGGDKEGNWDGWYKKAIPEADRLYEIYLQELSDDGLLGDTK